MSLLCGQRWYSESKRDLTQQTCFGTFIRRRHKTTRQATHRIVTDVHTRNIIHPDKQLMQSYLSLMSIPETSFHAETGKGSTWTSLPSFCFITMTWHKNMQLINLSSDLLPDTVPVATALGRRPGIWPPNAAAFGLGEAATRLAPRVKAWANESWKTRKLRIPKIS